MGGEEWSFGGSSSLLELFGFGCQCSQKPPRLRPQRPLKAAGPDSVSAPTPRHCAGQLSLGFTVIFNTALETCQIQSASRPPPPFPPSKPCTRRANRWVCAINMAPHFILLLLDSVGTDAMILFVSPCIPNYSFLVLTSQFPPKQQQNNTKYPPINRPGYS